MAKRKVKKNPQLVGNMGLYAVCYELSKRGWNVMPTSRNARGVDILGYDQEGTVKITVQVKALGGNNAVPFGTDPTLCNLIADYIIIAVGVRGDTPEYFVAITEDVRPLVHTTEKNGQKRCWLEPKDYKQFRHKWETVGNGWGPDGP
jgi:hypothetical protein